MKNEAYKMWFNNPKELRGDKTEVCKILNGNENIYNTYFPHSRNIVELEDMR